jgi:hypothetical protein
MINTEVVVVSKGGATSSKIPGIDQIPYSAIIALAKRYSLGEQKHGRDNWKQGLDDKKYMIERLGHVINHAYKQIAILQGDIPDDGDDNAGAIMWGGAMLAEFKKLQGE